MLEENILSWLFILESEMTASIIINLCKVELCEFSNKLLVCMYLKFNICIYF